MNSIYHLVITSGSCCPDCKSKKLEFTTKEGETAEKSIYTAKCLDCGLTTIAKGHGAFYIQGEWHR